MAMSEQAGGVVMQALVIAAGRGSRLLPVSHGRPKALVPVLGVPIIDRVVSALRDVGVADVVVTVGYQGQLIRDHLGSGERLGMRIRYAANEAWPDGNAGSVLAARDLLAGDFLLVMGDHLVDERILAAMVNERMRGSVLVAVDRRDGGVDVTRVLVEDGRVAGIGKQIPAWNATDIGVFRCSPTFLTELDVLVPAGVAELAAAVGSVDAHVVEIAAIEAYVPKLRKAVAPWWVDIDTATDLAAAERLLVNNASKNASDALAHWVHRPIENALVAPIARASRVTPNQLSFVVNVCAWAVTALFASGALLAASLLSFVVGLADGLDGKLARVTQRVTRVGSLEHSFDMLYEYSWILALAWALQRESGSAVPLVLAGAAVTLIAFYRSVYDQYGKQAGRSLDDSGLFERRFRRVAGRRNLYNIWILAGVLVGVPLGALWAIMVHAAVTAFIYSVRTIVRLGRLDRAGSPGPAEDSAGPRATLT
jgi:choline kinase/phosphatidylglycerophosphate synthase